jgi:2-polyprenyl-3-methyl-5-hydroxy-6-metoxy-1,4-benzoquinol methylase
MSQGRQHTPYVLDDRRDNYRRLVRMAEQYADETKEACRRVDISQGAKVIDVGCGPIGALLTLAAAVGPTGIVVGLDNDPNALRTARAILDANDLPLVKLVHADINTVQSSDVCPPGPFDLAYCRLLLVHQEDPIRTVTQMASMVRPGGHIVAHEWLYDPRYPMFDPAVLEMEHVERMLGRLMSQTGKDLHVARKFSAICQKVGLSEISQRGFLEAGPSRAAVFLEYQAYGTLDAAKASLVENKVATEHDINNILDSLIKASRQTYHSFFGLPFVELIAKVP